MNKDFQEHYTALGLNIGYYRRINNFTQLQLAEKLNIDPTHLGRIENAKVGASLDVVFAISNIFGLSPEKLFNERY